MKEKNKLKIVTKYTITTIFVCSFTIVNCYYKKIIGHWKINHYEIIKHPEFFSKKKLTLVSNKLKRTEFYFFNNYTYIDFSVDGLEIGIWNYYKKDKIIVKKSCDYIVDTLKLKRINFKKANGYYSSKIGFFIYFEMEKSLFE